MDATENTVPKCTTMTLQGSKILSHACTRAIWSLVGEGEVEVEVEVREESDEEIQTSPSKLTSPTSSSSLAAPPTVIFDATALPCTPSTLRFLSRKI